MTLLAAGAALILAACLAGLAASRPTAATIAWMFVLESTPEFWLTTNPATHETILAVMKAAGIALALILALKHGPKPDPLNPAFAFLVMFLTGLLHGLYPGLTLTDSLRSLLGSIAPFAFGFATLPTRWCRAIIRATTLGPLFAVGAGILLQLTGLHTLYDTSSGALRLTAGGEGPYLGGFALAAIAAGLLNLLQTPTKKEVYLLALNLLIILLTGDRAPLALALFLALAAISLPSPNLTAQNRLTILAATITLAALAFIFASSLGFLRVISLAQSGDTANLSHRNLVWPYFEAAIRASPWLGWGAGAGKVVIPYTATLAGTLGTNAAHNEYLRIGTEGGLLGLTLLITLMAAWAWRGSRPLPTAQRWFIRAVFLTIAINAATDNTLIATTSSILFLWLTAVFATATEPPKPPA